MDLRDSIRIIPDFPKEGISFKDITTLLQNPQALQQSVKDIAAYAKQRGAELIIGVESRGFILGAPVAYELGLGFVLVRKPGKLPGDVLRMEYDLEYGSDVLEIHTDSAVPGTKVVIIDDLLATGGTISAAADLVQRLGVEIVGLAFLIELSALKGRRRLKDYDILTLVQYED